MTEERLADLQAEIADLRRQLEIEATLESMRVEIAAMGESGDLGAVVRHVERSLKDLGATCDSVGINVIDEQNLTMMAYTASERGIGVNGPTPMVGVGFYAEYVAHWRARETYSRLMSVALRREEAHLEVERRGEEVDAGRLADYLETLTDRWVVDVPFPHGMVAMSRPGSAAFADSEIALLEHFASAFALAYARFLDLQAAEARARQMERQAAYERVRGAVLVARTSDDILAADALMARELKGLGVRFTACGINVIDTEAGEFRAFSSAGEVTISTGRDLDHPDLRRLLEHWQQGRVFARLADDAYRNTVREAQGSLGRAESPEARAFLATVRAVIDVPFAYGTLAMNSTEVDEFSPEEIDILHGFAEVISLAYTRYLDIQKLEEQHEQTRQANRLKSDFLARMSHDLRTPMNAILGYVGLLLRKTKDVIDDRQFRNLENIQQGGSNMLRLIDYMQDLSRIAVETPEVDLEDVDMGALVGDCVEAIRPTVDPACEVRVRIAVVEPVRTDAARVRQVLGDILDNAVKFTDEGSITVALRGAEGHVEIAVSDTGVGIPQEDLPYLFDEFYYMARTKSKPGAAGDGLSMARAKKSIELLGGILFADSPPGEGTTFTIRLGNYESAL